MNKHSSVCGLPAPRFFVVGALLWALFLCPALCAQQSALHPQCQSFLDALAKQNGPSWAEMGVPQARQTFASLTALFGEGPAEVQIENRVLPTAVAVRIYRPAERAADQRHPVVMFFHGGGWVLGDLDTHDALCRRLCAQVGAAIVAVDYRRSPEHVAPTAIEDCYAATAYVAEHGAELGLDSQRLVVAGDSAGGTLALGVALKARDQRGPQLAGQVLIYPALDPDCDSLSHVAFARGYGLTSSDMRWFWQQYLGDQPATQYAAPSQAATLAGLPPTSLVTAGYDVLRDEAQQFAQRLLAAGVSLKHHEYADMLHGFVHFAGAFDRGSEATREISRDLRHFLKIN